MKYTVFEVGQILCDLNLGCEWIVRKKLPNGVRLQVNKENGPYMDVTPENCRMTFIPVAMYYEVWLRENPDEPGGINDFDMCIKAVREPSIEEAEVFLKKDRENDPKHVLHVANLFEIDHEEAKASFDLSNESEWPVFGLTSEMLPEIGRRIWSRDMKESGRVTSKSRRYCAACQRVHPYYHVRWEKGNYTKPCVAGIESLPNGDFKIM